MGNLVGKAASGVAGIVFEPFRSLVDCGGVCSGGSWDVSCFMEHLCVVSLFKLFIFLVLSFVMLYVMCKVGLKCVVKRACRAGMSACSCSCHALRFLCHKLRTLKRVRGGRRGRRYDVEEGAWGGSGSGWISSSEECSSEGGGDDWRHGRGRAREGWSPARGRRQSRMRESLGPRKPSFKNKTTRRSYP
ncbi:uncharacterized protein LOC102705090 [Oryza brachyantha]|uniref:uncharacterized protein LOC102705090 n=1 Tax=Oryza brachyantha TaxID=4533 RepID=UPI0003EAC119|nr:uncharacterized protein LOC102705090 [Oryza brachyantha]